VRLAVVEAALDRRADPGRNRRIADVEIEGHMQAGGVAPRDRDRLLDDRRDARPIDVLHGEDRDARFAHQLFLAIVEVADTDENGLVRGHLRGEAAEARELRGLGPEERGQRHTVNVAARAAGRRVHVTVRVHPDQAKRLVLAPHVIGGRRDRAGRQRVVAAQYQWQAALLERGQRRLVKPFADARDLANVLLARVAERLGLGYRSDDVPLVDHRDTEGGQALAEAGNAEGGGPHVHPAAVAAKVEGHTDDVNGARHAPLG
jgi:hypothetical protein